MKKALCPASSYCCVGWNVYTVCDLFLISSGNDCQRESTCADFRELWSYLCEGVERQVFNRCKYSVGTLCRDYCTMPPDSIVTQYWYWLALILIRVLIFCWPCISIYLLHINKLDAINFIISLFQASACFEHMCSSSGGQNCILQSLVSSHLQVWWYQRMHNTILTPRTGRPPIGVMIPDAV